MGEVSAILAASPMKRFAFLSLLFFALPAFARQDVSLNGTWQMVKVASLDAAPPADGWKEFEVPGTIAGWKYEKAWLRRSFAVPANWRAQRVHLRFGGVKWNSQIFVNEKKFKGPLNGYDAFELDVTDAVKFGGDNELRVGVEDWTATFSPGEPVDLSKVDNAFAARGVPKNRVIAPFGGHNGNFGIWDDVFLLAVPPVHVEDVFIKPNLREKALTVDCTLENKSGAPFSGPVLARVLNYEGGGRDEGGQWKATREVATLRWAGPEISLGDLRSLSFRADKLPLEEWTPQNPKLYVLEIKAGDDVWRERFGWRQLWTQNGDFIFNGKKTHLLATSWWPNANKPLDRDTVASQLKAIRAANTFVFRTHTQPWPERWYEMADEIGVMMIPEGAVWCDTQVYAIEDERFWKNYGDHLTAMARRLRNHPSVVMYSLENEMGHCGGKDNPTMEAGFARMAKLMKAADPTRPLTFEADGDPGGQTDVIGIHYPNEYPQKRLWPNDAYWLDKPRKLSLFGPQPFLWKHDKPIYIGEYLWVYQNSSPAAHTVFFGDDAYKNHREYSARAKAAAWRMQIQAYRAQDVSGQSPWTMQENGPLDERNPTYLAHRDMYRPLAAFLKEYDARFFAGETVTRTVQLFNDTLKDEPLVRLHWELAASTNLLFTPGEIRASSGEKIVNLPAGSIKEEKIEITMPAGGVAKSLTLRLQVFTNGTERFRETWPVKIHLRPQWSAPLMKFANLSLFDPQGTLQTSWQRGAVPFKSLNKIEDWDGTGVLVVGPAPTGKRIETGVSAADLQPLAQQNKEPNAPVETQVIGAPSSGQKLAELVRDGGRVLVLEQNAADWLPVRLSDQSSTMSFAQLPNHPVLRDVSNADLRWWRGDHLVSSHEPLREAQAGHKSIIVTGSEAGVSHAPLLEIAYGQGAWLICQMQAASKMDSEPAARQLLENAFKYLALYQAPPSATLVSGSDALGEKLTRLGAECQLLRDWNALQFPTVRTLILQADNATVAQNADRLKAFMQAGGQVLWHRPAAENFDAAARALGLTIERTPYRGPAPRADEVPAEFQLLTREDLYWLGAPSGVAWNAAPLAPVAEATFGEAPKEIQGTTYEAENAPQFAGQIVRVDGGEVGFFTGGSAMWKVKIPADGRYTLSLYARGTPFKEVFPQVALSLDEQPIGIVSLTQKAVRFYNATFDAKAGEHMLKAEFANDQGDDKEDRNLWIDRFVIGAQTETSPLQNLTDPAALARYPIGKGGLILSAITWDEPGGNAGKANRFAASLLTALGARWRGQSKASRVEPEKMNPQPNLNWFRRESDHVYMGAGGTIEGPVRIEKAGRYHVDVWGKGTKGAGVYPIVVLDMGGAEIGRVEIKSDDWAPHSLAVDLPQGEKTLRLRFINDDAPAPEDRNLWLERLEFEKSE